MMKQTYRPFHDIIIIAPKFQYKGDTDVYPYDAYWNSTKVQLFFFDVDLFLFVISFFLLFVNLITYISFCLYTYSLGEIGVLVHNRILDVVVTKKGRGIPFL